MLMREKGIQMSDPQLSDPQQVRETAEAFAKYPLPTTYVRWADAIAKWIDVTVPCVTDEQSQAVTDMVVRYLRSSGVSDMVISEALSKSVYKYSYSSQATFNLRILVPLHEQQSPQTSMGPAPPRNPQIDEWQAQKLDRDFMKAADAGDIRAMEAIAQLLVNMLYAHGRAKQAKEKMDAVGAEILRNAPNIARVIRVVGPERPVPGPDGRTPRRVGPNTYVLDIDALKAAEAEAKEGGEDGDGDAD